MPSVGHKLHPNIRPGLLDEITCALPKALAVDSIHLQPDDCDGGSIKVRSSALVIVPKQSSAACCRRPLLLWSRRGEEGE
jgi:hypothetical protein